MDANTLASVIKDFSATTLTFISANKPFLSTFLSSAVGAGCGAWFGAGFLLDREQRLIQREVETAANIAIADLITLLGRLLNFKKDLVAPAASEALELSSWIEALGKPERKEKLSIRLELWPEIPFALQASAAGIYRYTGKSPEVIQLLKSLEYNLTETCFLVGQRNALITRMNAHQAARGALPQDGLRLYMKYTEDLSRLMDENLFFIDMGIDKVRAAARKELPKGRHNHIADVGLKPETHQMMPPKDYIKGWIRSGEADA